MDHRNVVFFVSSYPLRHAVSQCYTYHMRQIEFAQGEFYHVYNHAIEGVNLIRDATDSERFIEGLLKFNAEEPIGSIYLARFEKVEADKKLKAKPLVNIVCYCLNPNHFHLMLEEVAENGIQKFMHRLTMGHCKYMNAKYKRKGVLFQGNFRAKLLDDNDYLLHTSAYINLNDRVHQLRHAVSQLVRSSWEEYINPRLYGICKRDIVLDQFRPRREYEAFALDALELMLEAKEDQTELKELEFED